MATKTKWTIDPEHSEIAFKIKHLMISNVKGVFREFDAKIYTDNTDFSTAEIDVWIDASSIDTANEKRDTHLKSAEFFDAEKNKQITFKADTIHKLDSKNNYEVWGNLVIKGISKRIRLNVEFGGMMKDPWGNEKAGFNVTGTINRKDWGLTWNAPLEAGGFMVGDEVTINCEVELVKAINSEKETELAEEKTATA